MTLTCTKNSSLQNENDFCFSHLLLVSMKNVRIDDKLRNYVVSPDPVSTLPITAMVLVVDKI